MKQELLLSTLLAMRAQLDMLIAAFEAGNEECQHPEGERISTATMGNPGGWSCRRCGHENRG